MKKQDILQGLLEAGEWIAEMAETEENGEYGEHIKIMFEAMEEAWNIVKATKKSKKEA